MPKKIKLLDYPMFGFSGTATLQEDGTYLSNDGDIFTWDYIKDFMRYEIIED